VLVDGVEELDAGGVSDESAMSGGRMKLGTLVLMLTLLAAPACGGGGGGSDAGGSPSAIAASFVPDQPTPGANTVALAEGSKSNDVVTVNVTLTSTNGVFATAFDAVYDDIHTVFLGFAPGTALEQGGNNTNYTVNTANPGRIVVGVSRTGSSTTNVSGTKVVLGLQFRVNQPGVYPVAIENAVVYDGQSSPQPIAGISWFAGAVTGV
jgi:hypothetical protein